MSHDPQPNIDQDLLRETAEEMFEHAPAGYLSTLPDGRIIQVNQTLIDWLGCPRETLLGPPGMCFQDLLTLPGKVFHDTHYAPLMRMQGFVKELALDLQPLNRDPLPTLVSATQKRDQAGRPLLNRLTVFDATDRRHYERELLQARRRAEQAADAERAAREEAERLGRAKDDFLATLSHELRTPLSAILGWTQLLTADPALSEELREGLGVIERNTKVQVQLVDDLLDMGRIISGKMRLDVQRLELIDVVASAIETVGPAATAKNIRVDKILDPGVVVSGDPGRLQQVFWNLLNNAVKFTPKGGVVRVVMQRVNSHVEVSVIDNGQGMSADFVAHAFERFRQSESQQGTRRSGGLGLGLSIVKSVVEMHGGSVQAHSEGEGKGSTFVVHLPVVAIDPRPPMPGDAQRVHPRATMDQGAASATSPTVADLSLAGLRVLVVDDEPDARDLLQRVMSYAGADVFAASSAVEALALVESVRPDVLISDIGMPEVDGYELIRRVRMLGPDMGGRVAAIALTAFARLEDRTRAMLAGFQMHLAKPVDPRELIVTVANLAGRL